MNSTSLKRPRELGELLEILEAEGGKATVVAGGTNLIPQMRHGGVKPECLVDIGSMSDLSFIEERDGRIVIGAATTIAEIAKSDLLGEACPILATAAGQLGNPLTRNRATIGGNLADASPCADTAPPLLALEATVHVAGSPQSRREVPMSAFFMGYRFTQVKKGEAITHVSIPRPSPGTKGGHTKIGLRRAAAICVASIALMLEFDGETVAKARVAVGSVAPTPQRTVGVEDLLTGQKIDDTLLEAAAEQIKKEISPISDIRGSAEYRTHVTAVLLKRHLKEFLA